MTTTPMLFAANSFTAAARSAVGSIVTTSPRLSAKMFLTIIAASLDPAAECSPAFRFIDNDPPRGWLRQETVHCNKIAPQCQLTADIAPVALTLSLIHISEPTRRTP